MPTIRVQPRETPPERADTPVVVQVDDDVAAYAEQLEEWVAPLEHWELAYREGHLFDRANNVEARLVFADHGHTNSLLFRLDEIGSLQTFELELWMTLDENEGIANAVHCAPHGMDVDLFHLVGPPLGGTAS